MKRPDLGTLWLVATPIGDPDDLSPRARRVLIAAEGVAAEDTRVTEQLLRGLGAWPKRLVSCHDHNERGRAGEIVGKLLDGQSWALVSDAGTPLVSDPGFVVVRAALAADIRVVPVPGPCAAVVALVASGLPPDAWRFCGFLPRDPGPRLAAAEALAYETATLVFYESPRRLLEGLDALHAALGDRRVAVAFELTKTYERWHRGTLAEVRAELMADEDTIRGEATVVVAGFEGEPGAKERDQVLSAAAALGRAGVAPSVVRDALAATFGVPRRDVYQAALAAGQESNG